MNRKQGETYIQLLKRATSEINRLENIISEQSAIMQESEAINSRSGRSYKEEAQFMFLTLAIIERELRGDNTHAMFAARQALEELGFNIVDQYENKCLKDGAYNG
jgi:hypothetical protein